MPTVIASRIVPNFRPRGEIEAWFNDGCNYCNMPDWVRSHYDNRPHLPKPLHRSGQYALRDDEGYFWKWMKADLFNLAYERITP